MSDGEHYSYMCDAWSAGFKINPMNSEKHPDNNLLPSECDALLLSRDNTDYEELAATSLFSVNGLVDRGIVLESGIMLKESFRHTDPRNQVSILRFDKLGTLDIIPITPDNFIVQGNIPIRESFVVDCKIPVTDKVIIGVLNGFIHINDDAFDIVGPTTIKITAYKIPMLERYLSALDLGKYNLPAVSTIPPYVIDQKTFHSNDNLFRFITHGDSFITLLNAEDVSIESVDVGNKLLPGRYSLPGTNNNIAVYHGGEVADYILTGSKNGFVLTTVPNLTWKQRNHTTDYRDNVGTTIEPDPPFSKEYGGLRLFKLTKVNPHG